jgi:hypothetical protein
MDYPSLEDVSEDIDLLHNIGFISRCSVYSSFHVTSQSLVGFDSVCAVSELRNPTFSVGLLLEGSFR